MIDKIDNSIPGRSNLVEGPSSATMVGNRRIGRLLIGHVTLWKDTANHVLVLELCSNQLESFELNEPPNFSLEVSYTFCHF